MTDWLDAILIWAALKLPEAKAGWVTDLRHEARHVPSDMRRAQFLFSGVLAALGQLLRIHVGPRRVGQGLIGLALLGLCFSVGMAALATDDRTVQTTFFSVLPLYGIACALVVLNLRWMRRYTVCCGLLLAVVSLTFGLPMFQTGEIPIRFLRALTFEASFIMAGIFIAASYLSWIEEGLHS